MNGTAIIVNTSTTTSSLQAYKTRTFYHKQTQRRSQTSIQDEAKWTGQALRRPRRREGWVRGGGVPIWGEGKNPSPENYLRFDLKMEHFGTVLMLDFNGRNKDTTARGGSNCLILATPMKQLTKTKPNCIVRAILYKAIITVYSAISTQTNPSVL